MSSGEFENGIEKLRHLREKLCTSDAEWKKAFEVRDTVINGLRSLQLMLDDKGATKKECSVELKKLLKYYEDNSDA